MKGTLLGAFCERGDEQPARCLELWVFPDSSVNLVLNRQTPGGEEEHSFPMALYQLLNVLRKKTFRAESACGTVVLQREEGLVFAEFRSETLGPSWRYCIPIEPFAHALAQVAPEATHFLS